MQANSSEQKIIMFRNIFLNHKKTAILIIIAVFLIIIDRILKALAFNYLKIKPVLLTDWLKLDFTISKNIAFSLPLYGILLSFAIIILIIILIWSFIKMVKKNQLLQASLILFIILGALSNLIDRFLYSGIVDYIDIKNFTIFNLADAMILFGVIFFIRLNLKAKQK